MNTEDFKRKLTAVFSADVVGYSRLMGENEAATVKTLETYKQVMFSLIKQHRGRVVDSPGDNILAEFTSVVDAVQCAVAVQKEFQIRNAELADNRRMEFRIGINLGDVIEEEDRIYGDGVNIAARLEALADPGGICISKTVFDQIETKLPLGYHFLGEQTVKNIARPVGAYKVIMEPRITGTKAKDQARGISVWRSKPVLAGVIAVLIIIIAGIIWNFYGRAPKIEPASKEKMAFPLPDKPSIAVLPFVNMSDDPKQEYLCDGITESIITAISKFHELFVIARNSTFSYKKKAVKVQQVAEELGVQYVLEGSVQRSGDKLRITTQLIDALNGRHIWAQRYDRQLADLFAMQDDITIEVLQAMRIKLTEGEQISRLRRPKSVELAMKLYEAQDYGSRYNPEDNKKALRLVEEIIAEDPDWGEALFELSTYHMMEVWMGTTESPKESMEKAIKYCEKAVSLEDSYAQAVGMLGYYYGMLKDLDKALAYCEKAVAMDPNSADAHALLGNALRNVSRSQEAISHFEVAMRLNPFPPQHYYVNFAGALQNLDRYEEALTLLKKASVLWPISVSVHQGLISVYCRMGKDDEASATAAELLKISPEFSVKKMALSIPDQEYRKKWIDCMHKAGLPD